MVILSHSILFWWALFTGIGLGVGVSVFIYWLNQGIPNDG